MADAVDLPPPQVLLQPFRGAPAAQPVLPIGGARLIRLGRVNALQTDVLAGNDNRIAIDDLGGADDVGLRRDGAGYQESGKNSLMASFEAFMPGRPADEKRNADLSTSRSMHVVRTRM